ncbi:GT-D fold domain-containing glycosyltransferase [Paenibacillus polysaccharolyticus]|uniref:GT-D fold domain-containing glycosyltransferase n=1 Tax=Paenibacillus polysaccharolyticus TaxID=582692 RepID=UPI0012B95F34|nr:MULTISPECIES: GT-D fold domain-containing glycosyltransferase [Paenibacillus]MCP1135315.1 GT-D fold domain-containing glycosyltransferase [Paenibacillus polysaccharolyticus]
MKSTYLEMQDVLDQLEAALQEKRPFSLVRVGDGENIVMSQESVWPMEQVLQERWAIKANLGQKGLRLPNLKMRDEVAASLKRATIVGVLPRGDSTIKAPDYLKRPLTDMIFAHYGIAPALTCHACVNRELVQVPRFWHMLAGKRVLLVTRELDELQAALVKEPYHLDIVSTLAFDNYDQMDETLQWIQTHQDDFDVALFSCGVNAVILAERTAALAGKVAIDFGKANNMILKGRAN